MAIIDFSPKSLYILGPNGNHELIGHFIEINESATCSDTNENSLNACEESVLTCSAKLSKEAIMTLFGVHEMVLICCPNKRVVHLARNGRTRRICKKNFNRAIKILEEG